jgi:hypothetical protein
MNFSQLVFLTFWYSFSKSSNLVFQSEKPGLKSSAQESAAKREVSSKQKIKLVVDQNMQKKKKFK